MKNHSCLRLLTWLGTRLLCWRYGTIKVKEMDKEMILEMAYEAMTKVEFLKTREEKRMYLAALCDAMIWGWPERTEEKTFRKPTDR